MELHSTIAEAVDGALDRTRRSRKRLKRKPRPRKDDGSCSTIEGKRERSHQEKENGGRRTEKGQGEKRGAWRERVRNCPRWHRNPPTEESARRRARSDMNENADLIV